MTWLLVEDDNDIRNVVAVMMSVWGEKPLSFADGNAAWAWLDSVANGTFTGELPDLALMDIRMPGYTGDKVAARIRETPGIKDIPIILMTAFSLSEAEVKAMTEQAGIDHLINKPLPDMEVFRSTLYRVRDERRARLASAAKPAEAAAQPATQAQPEPQQPAATPTAPAQSASQPAPKPGDQPTPAQPTAAPAEPTKSAQQSPSQQPTAPAESTSQPAAKPGDQSTAAPAEPAKPAQPPTPAESTSQPAPKPAEPVKPAQPSENKSK